MEKNDLKALMNIKLFCEYKTLFYDMNVGSFKSN